MKVLFVAYQASMYGANKSLFNLIMDLKDRYNIEPCVLMMEEGDFSKLLNDNNVEVIVMNYYRWMTIGNGIKSRIKSFFKIILNRIKYKKIIDKLKERKFDIVHTNSSITDIGSEIAMKLKVPHVWHIREYGIDDYNMYYMLPQNIIRKKYINSDRVIAISESIFNYYCDELRLCSKDNCEVVYNGLPIPEQYDKKHLKDEVFNFCICGVVTENKNQLQAIEACYILKNKGIDQFKLHIIGGQDEKYLSLLEEKIIKYDISDNVIFWGYRRDVSELLKGMDVGIMTSRKEAFGRVTIEYMLNYMPVIGADSGGTTELIEDGKNGLLYKLNDTNILAKDMEFYIKNKSSMISMGLNARSYAENNFSMKKNTDSIYHIYQSVYLNKKTK